jgi:positive regulator of sigma E activity
VAGSDAWAAAGGLIGLSLGFVLVKAISLRRRMSAVAQPVILSSPA